MTERSLLRQQQWCNHGLKGGPHASTPARGGLRRARSGSRRRGLDLACGRGRVAALPLRPHASVRRGAAPRCRDRRRSGRGGACPLVGNRHLRGDGPVVGQERHDHHRRRLCRHAHTARLDRGHTRRGRRGGIGRRADRRHRGCRHRAALRPPRRAGRGSAPGLPRSADLPAGAHCRTRCVRSRGACRRAACGGTRACHRARARARACAGGRPGTRAPSCAGVRSPAAKGAGAAAHSDAGTGGCNCGAGRRSVRCARCEGVGPDRGGDTGSRARRTGAIAAERGERGRPCFGRCRARDRVRFRGDRTCARRCAAPQRVDCDDGTGVASRACAHGRCPRAGCCPRARAFRLRAPAGTRAGIRGGGGSVFGDRGVAGASGNGRAAGGGGRRRAARRGRGREVAGSRSYDGSLWQAQRRRSWSPRPGRMRRGTATSVTWRASASRRTRSPAITG